MAKKLGIIQTRGLGDIVIALPIANHYRREGWDVLWPIVDEWVEPLSKSIPWIKWIPMVPDQGLFFYHTPLERLKNFKCDEILPLYQALTGQTFHDEAFFQHTKFDQYKYFKAGVPFHEKWRLAECIIRDPVAEQSLFDKLVINPNYVVVHLEGSDHRAAWDPSMVPSDWQIIEITPSITNNVFDWLTILERAQSLILVDSVFANIVDQMNIGDDRYFIPRSHIGLTPVLGNHWTWLDNPNMSMNAKTIGVPN
jgi:hypothetical protein